MLLSDTTLISNEIFNFRFNGIICYMLDCNFKLNLIQTIASDCGIWDIQFSSRSLDILLLQEHPDHLQVLHADTNYIKRKSIYSAECDNCFKGNKYS